MKKFIGKNIFVKLFVPTAMAFCLNLILNYNNSFYDLKKHVFNPTGFTLFPNDWFIYALIICYLIFYITNTVKIYAGRFIFSFAMLCPFVVFCAYSGWHRNWWATPMAFLMGGNILPLRGQDK